MTEIIQVGERYYVAAGSALADDRTRILKQGETFAVFDRRGDIQPLGQGQHGVFHEGMRRLSGLTLEMNGERPLLLSSNVSRDNTLLTVDLTNIDILEGDAVVLPRGSLHVHRSKFLWAGRCYEEIRLHNFGPTVLMLPLSVRFAADFLDIFELRGVTRKERGETVESVIEPNEVALVYKGLDGVERWSRLRFDPAPVRLSPREALFEISLRRSTVIIADEIIDLCVIVAELE